MTEGEAKTKWCPFVRVVVASHTGRSGARNRVVETADTGEIERVLVEGLAGAHCIGSACMAWRPDTTSPRFGVALDDREEEVWSWDPIEAGQYEGRVKVRRLDADSKGHCGLAGPPQ